METTAQSLLDFWNWAARKGLVSSSIANDLRAATREVMGVEEHWESLDVRNMDVDYLMVRFENLSKFKFKPQSLSAYKSRFKKARKLYLDYLENPSGWHYPTSAPKRRPTLRETPDGGAAITPVGPTSSQVPQGPAAGLVRYPFPLRGGLTVNLDLPADITHEEAERLASYLKLIVT